MKISGWAMRFLVPVGLALVCSLGVAGAAAASSGVPYTDPNAVGYIGLCNQAGHQITSGSINTTPFAWRAVSTQPAPAPYNNAYRTAILLAYQPQQGLAPGEWSGDELTASSRYTNPANPMTAATGGDDSLEDFIEEFHPKWDGYLQLRMYLGTQNEQQYELHYPALNIEVTGNTWSAVGGGPVNCNAGSSVSIESIVLPTTTTTTKSSPATTSTPTGSTVPAHTTVTEPGTHPSGVKNTSGQTATEPDIQRTAARADPSRPTNHTLIIVAVIAVLLVLAGAVYLISRRRRPASYPSESGTTRSSSTKGH
jgi:hypothetical protein